MIDWDVYTDDDILNVIHRHTQGGQGWDIGQRVLGLFWDQARKRGLLP